MYVYITESLYCIPELIQVSHMPIKNFKYIKQTPQRVISTLACPRGFRHPVVKEPGKLHFILPFQHCLATRPLFVTF